MGADASCFAVAAASVLAKVTRDRMMVELAPGHPEYRFETNKGYPSPVHRAAIARLGLTALHRASWSFARPKGEVGDESGVPADGAGDDGKDAGQLLHEGLAAGLVDDVAECPRGRHRGGDRSVGPAARL